MTPPVAGALFLAAFVASCLRGALPPVDLRAVCFVRAMLVCGAATGLEQGVDRGTLLCYSARVPAGLPGHGQGHGCNPDKKKSVKSTKSSHTSMQNGAQLTPLEHSLPLAFVSDMEASSCGVAPQVHMLPVCSQVVLQHVHACKHPPHGSLSLPLWSF